MSRYRALVGIVLGLAAIGFISITADREFIYLAPTYGREYSVLLENNRQYTQEFRAGTTQLSRIGLYIHPTQKNVPNNPITLSITQNEELLGQQSVYPVFLSTEPDEAVFAQFAPALPIDPTLPVTLKLTVPSTLSRKVTVQQRMQDKTFNTDARFFIDNEPQQHPLAYRISAIRHPAITLHLGILAAAAALILITKSSLKQPRGQLIYAAAISLAAAAPGFEINVVTPILIIIQLSIAFIALQITTRWKLHLPAKLLGVHIATACSSWSLLFLGHWRATQFSQHPIAHFREVILDPNQLALNGAGAYIGITATVFVIISFISVLISQKSDWGKSKIAAGAAVALAGIFTIPVATGLSAAMLGALGMQSLHQFLGKKDKLLVTVLLSIIAIIALLDLLSVQARIMLNIFFI